MCRIWYKVDNLTGKKRFRFWLEYWVLNLCLESTILLEKVKGGSIMSSVDEVSNVLDYRKEEVVTTPLSEKKSLTKDVDKGTGELEDMKEALVTILGKDLDTLYFRSKGYTGWFNNDVKFKNKSTINPWFYRNIFLKDIEGHDTEFYKTFFVPFDK